MTGERTGVSVTDVGGASMTIKVADYDELAEDHLENGLHRPTMITYTVTIINGVVETVTRKRRGEVGVKYNWKEITDPMDNTIPPAELPEEVKETVFETVFSDVLTHVTEETKENMYETMFTR